MLDRLDRTDIVNAVALAAVLLLFGYGILALIGVFRDTVDDGLINAERVESIDLDEEDFDVLAIPTEEIVVRVGNRTVGRQGLAGRATRRIDAVGYGTLEAVNADSELEPIDESFVYFAESEDRSHALQVAELLNIDESQVLPMVDEPGISTEGASIIVILGQLVQF